MKVRFVHCSDLHLGAPYSMLPRQAADRRRADQRETLGRIVDLAVGAPEKADLLLIAGDLFDSDHPSLRDVTFVRTQLERLGREGVRVFMIPGNHDPWRERNFWSRAAFPNVRLFTQPRFECEVLRGLRLNVCAIAPDPSNYSKNQLAAFDASVAAGPSILLHHGSWLNFGGESADCHPFSTDDIRRLPFSYIALGHYHASRQVDSRSAYPGTPDAVGFSKNDLGPRYVMVGTLDGEGRVDVHPHQINVVSHVMEEIDCTAESCQSLRQRVERLLERSAYVRIRLTGRPATEVIAAAERLRDELSDMATFLAVESSFSNVADVPADNIYLKRFVEKVNARMQNAPEDQQPLLSKALELGIRAFLKE
ncbi:MAG TPA: DNA repair exonuclease [Planctomycetota bacterium]|nr:DNA repair exonuclease [Planctomycetota bacterium]